MGQSNRVTWRKVLSAFSSQGKNGAARQLFHRMAYRDSVSWNSMMRTYIENGRFEEARDVFDQMQVKDSVAWNTMIKAYCSETRVYTAFKLFLTMPTKQKDIITWTVMINGLARISRIDSWRLFRQMPTEPNSVAWASIISGFQQNGSAAEALTLFKEMLFVGTEPTSHAFTSALTACGNLAALTGGQQLYSHVLKRGLHNKIHVANAAISMFIKAGDLGHARSIFDEMPQRDTVTWNSMIMGFGKHGHGEKSIEFFNQMQDAGFQPEALSFLGVLHGCSHCGSLEEAKRYFVIMERDFGIYPKAEHYACMVDLLARAGLLESAVEMIHQMPFKPTGILWKSLLNGCRIHRNLEVGSYAARRILELQSHNTAAYLLILEMYVAAGRWQEVNSVRKLIKESDVKKELGCSWVEIKGMVHLFTAKDETHLASASIYDMLNFLGLDVRPLQV